MTMRGLVGFGTAFLVACGPESDNPPIDCDADAVPLIEIGAQELIQNVQRVGDRVVAEVHVSDEDIVAEESFSTKLDRIVASDGCGTEPVVLASELSGAAQPIDPILPWFITREGDAMESGSWLLDVETGERHRVDEKPAYVVAWLDDGLVIERDGGEIVVFFVDAGSVDEKTLHPDLHVARHYPGGVQRVIAGTTDDGELIAIDPRTGTQQHIADDVHDASVVDPDARITFISRLNEDFDTSFEAFDRETGRQVTLSPLGSNSYSLRWSQSMVIVSADDPGEPNVKIVLLPELRELNLDGRWQPGDSAPDGTRVLNGEDGVYVLRPDAEQPELLVADALGTIIGDRVFGYTVTPEGWPTTLWNVSLDRSEFVELLEDGSFHGVPIPLGADRWAYPNADGDLLQRDRASGLVHRLATDVWPDLDLLSPSPWDDVDLVRDEVFFIREHGPRALWRVSVHG